MSDRSEIAGANYIIRKSGLSGTSGSKEIGVPKTAYNHQVSLATIVGGPTTGSVVIAARPVGSDTYENVQSGTIDPTAPLTLLFNGYFDSIKLTWSTFNGTSFAAVLAGGA